MANINSDYLSKLTGLPVDEVTKELPKNPRENYLQQLTGVAPKDLPAPSTSVVSPLSDKRDIIDLTNTYTDPIGNYVDYGVPLNPFADWNDIRAKNQGVLQKLGYGSLKMLGTAGSAVVENTLGVVSGIYSSATGGTYADNFVGRGVDNFNGWMSENLPHYYENKELDPYRTIGSSLGSANFWTDKFANGLGYSLGSIATVWLTGGEGMLSKSVGAVGKATSTIGKAAEAEQLLTTGAKLKNMYQASKLVNTGAKLTKDVNAAAKLARNMNAFSYLETGTMMSLAESSVEAREKSKQFVQEEEAKWQEKNPGKGINEMAPEERAAIMESARAIENVTFGANLPILTLTNLLQFGSMVKGLKTTSKAVNKTIFDSSGKLILDLPKSGFGKFMAKSNMVMSPVYKNSLEEAFQEGAQFMIGEAAIDYYKNKFDSGITDVASSTVKALQSTFGSADGIESMLLGALIGGGMGAGSTIRGSESKLRETRRANTEKLMNIVNSETFMNTAAKLDQHKELAQFKKAMDAANDLGNYKVAEELRKNFMAQHAMIFDGLDAMDLAFEKLDDQAAMPEAEFKKLHNFKQDVPLIEQTGGKNQHALVQEWKDEMNKYVELGKKIDDIIQFNTPSKSAFGKLLQSTEQKTIQAAQNLYNQKLKRILMTNMIGIESRDEEIEQAFEKIRGFSTKSESFVMGFAAFDRNKLVTLVKRNKVSIDAQGNLVIPNALVNVDISDTDAEGKKKDTVSTETAKDKKNQKENEEFLSALQKAIEESQSFDPLKKKEFDEAVTSLFGSVIAREEAIAAFEELVKDPAKRDIVVAAKDAAAVKATIENNNKEADVVVDEARSTTDLDSLADNLDALSPEVRKKVTDKFAELRKQEAKYIAEYNDLPDDVLQELMDGIEEIESEDPQKALAIREIYAARKGETTEAKEKRAKGKTQEEQDLEAEANATMNSALANSSSAQTEQDTNSSAYQNKLDDRGFGRSIKINGTEYQILDKNPMDAFEFEEVQTEEGTAKVLKSITMTNNLGQKVIFEVDKDRNLVYEIAEIVATAYLSAGTIDTIGLKQEEFKVLIEARIAAIEEMLKKAEAKTDIKLSTATPVVLQKAADEYNKVLKLITEQISVVNSFYINSNAEVEVLMSNPYTTKLGELLKTANDKFEIFTKELQDKTRIPATIEPPTEVVGPMTESEEVELQNKIGEAQMLSDLAAETILSLGQKIEALEAADAVGVLSVENKQSIEDLKKELEKTKAEKEFADKEVVNLQKEYEDRKSSETSQNLQNAEGAEGNPQEQGPGGPSEGAVQVPESEESDVNDVDDAETLLSSKIVENPEFLLQEGETLDYADSADFDIETEEDIATDVDPEEDPDVIVTRNTSTPDSVPTSSGMNVFTVKAEYEYTNNYDNVVVDENGTPNTNSYYKEQVSSETGRPIKIAPHLLTNEDLIPLNSEIFFQVEENTKWWQETGKNSYDESDHWKQVPIYVVAKTTTGKLMRVGMLEAYNPSKPNRNTDRQVIYEQFTRGKNVDTTLTGKLVNSQNIANAVTKDGQPFFYDPAAQGNPTIIIARETGSPKWELMSVGEDLANENIDTSVFSLESKEMGSVAMVVKTPDGSLQHIKLVTKPITETAYNAVVDGIISGDNARVKKIVGFNEVIRDAVDLKDKSKIFAESFGKDPETAETGYVFYLPSAESYIRINSEELGKLLSGTTKTNAIYSFVDAKATDEGAHNFEINTQRSDHKTHVSGIKKAFKEAIMSRRFEVDKNELIFDAEREGKFVNPISMDQEYDSYMDYLTDPTAVADISKDQGHSGILSSDVVLNSYNSPYFNVTMQFGEPMVDGKPLIDETEIAPAAAKASIAVKASPVTKQEEYTDDEETFDAEESENSLDLDTSNDLIDEDEFTDEELYEDAAEEQFDENGNTITSLEELKNKFISEQEEEEEEGEVKDLRGKVKNENLKGTIAEEEEDPIEPLVAVLDNISKNEFKGMYVDPVTKQETHYIINGENFDRVTTATSEPFEGSAETQKASSEAGNAVHTVVEDILMNRPYKKPANMSAVSFLDLKSQVESIKALIKGRKQTVIATEMIVYNDLRKLAGKFDILVKNRNGSYVIYDIKTGSVSGLEYYEKGYTDPKTRVTKKSKRQQHGSQLSVYGYMLQGHGKDNNIDVKVTAGHVLYLPIEYNETGKITKVHKYAEKNFTLNYDIKNVLAGNVSFEQKVTAPASDPAVANTGKSKGSTKSKDTGRTIKSEKSTAPTKKDSNFGKGAMKLGDVNETLKGMIINDVIDAQGLVDVAPTMLGKTITLEEAEEIIEKTLEENC